MQGMQTSALSKNLPVLPNIVSPLRSTISPLLADSFNATAGAILATAGVATQIIITPFDNFGNRANITTPEAYRITVEASATGKRRRALLDSAASAVLDVSKLAMQFPL